MNNICKEMLEVLEKLSNSPTARIDAREWAKYFKKKFKKKEQLYTI